MLLTKRSGVMTMLFYKIEMESDRALESSEQKMRKTRARIKERTEEANERSRGEMSFFVSEIHDRKGLHRCRDVCRDQGSGPGGPQEGP